MFGAEAAERIRLLARPEAQGVGHRASMVVRLMKQGVSVLRARAIMVVAVIMLVLVVAVAGPAKTASRRQAEIKEATGEMAF